MDDEPAEGRTLPAVHVYPVFGPEHRFEHLCWCCPDYELAAGGVVVIHHVMH